jgi:hypothetical protein
MRRDWSPYREGRWIWTTDGWYWHSYEPFGYITYHYGRWYYDDYYGWLWVPGYEYAPAWVEWRYGDDYIGWAPLHPYTTIYFTIGVIYPHSYHNPYYHWNFVTYNHFYDPHVYNYCIGPRYKYRIHTNTHYRTNYVRHNGRIRNNGVNIDVVRNRSGKRIGERDLIRVSDERTLKGKDNIEKDRIRTVFKSRDELKRNEVRSTEIKRSKHKTSLDLSKVQIREVKESNKINSNREEPRKQVNKRTNEKKKYSGTNDRNNEPTKQVVREKNSREKSNDKNLYRINNGSNEKRNKDKNSSIIRNEQKPKKKTVKQNVNRNRNNEKNVKMKTNKQNNRDNKKVVSNKKRNNTTTNKNSSNNQRKQKSNSEKNSGRKLSKR